MSFKFSLNSFIKSAKRGKSLTVLIIALLFISPGIIGIIIPEPEINSNRPVDNPKMSLGKHLKSLSTPLGINLLASWVIYILINQTVTSLGGIFEINKRNLKGFIKEIENAENVQILDIWTDLTNDDNLEGLEQSLKKDKAKSLISIKILLSNPYSESLEQRSEDLLKEKNTKEFSKQGVAKLFNIYKNNNNNLSHRKNKIEVRLFSSTPSIGFYSWGDRAFFSVYPPEQKADDSPNLEIFTASSIGQYITNHFDQLWKAKNTISLEKHMMVSLYIEKNASSPEEINNQSYFILASDITNNEKGIYLVFSDAELRKSLRSLPKSEESRIELRFQADFNILKSSIIDNTSIPDNIISWFTANGVFLDDEDSDVKNRVKESLKTRYCISEDDSQNQLLCSSSADPSILFLNEIKLYEKKSPTQLKEMENEEKS